MDRKQIKSIILETLLLSEAFSPTETNLLNKLPDFHDIKHEEYNMKYYNTEDDEYDENTMSNKLNVISNMENIRESEYLNIIGFIRLPTVEETRFMTLEEMFNNYDIKDINMNKDKIAIIGLGYVGLPLCIELVDHYNVYGYDLNTARINELKNKWIQNNNMLD